MYMCVCVYIYIYSLHAYIYIYIYIYVFLFVSLSLSLYLSVSIYLLEQLLCSHAWQTRTRAHRYVRPSVYQYLTYDTAYANEM